MSKELTWQENREIYKLAKDGQLRANRSRRHITIEYFFEGGSCRFRVTPFGSVEVLFNRMLKKIQKENAKVK